MSKWADDYEDAVYGYDNYGDDDDEDAYTPLPKAPQPKPAHQPKPFVRKPKATQGDQGTTELSNRNPLDAWTTLDGQKKTGTSSGNAEQPPAVYRMDPELERLCQEMEKSEMEGRMTLHLVILGHVDAGKSTLMGRLLHELGCIDHTTVRRNEREAAAAGKASFSWAWALDERPEERTRGVTVDVATSRFQTKRFDVVLLDAPGHRDFVPNMIGGAAQADAALLVVDGSINGFEAGFQVAKGSERSMGGGQTREHAQLARSLGIEQIGVVITKLDTCDYTQNRYEEIQQQLGLFLHQCGFHKNAIRWLICSAPTGINLTASPDDPRLTWYKGPTVLDAINTFTPITRNIGKKISSVDKAQGVACIEMPLRMPVVDVIQSRTLGSRSVSGKIEAGVVRIGSQICLMPSGHSATVKAIEINKQPRDWVKAGDSCEIGMTEIEPTALSPGSVLCLENWPCPVVSAFECRVVILESSIPILPGLQVSLHAHALRQSARIRRLVSILDGKSGGIIKVNPRCLLKGQTAMIECETDRVICLELYVTHRPLGRVTLRESGRTMAVGIVSKLL